MKPSSKEDRAKRRDALIKLHEALDNFGEIWQYSFTEEQIKQNYSMTQAIGPTLAKLYIIMPVQSTFVISAILIEQIENAMAALADADLNLG